MSGKDNFSKNYSFDDPQHSATTYKSSSEEDDDDEYNIAVTTYKYSFYLLNSVTRAQDFH